MNFWRSFQATVAEGDLTMIANRFLVRRAVRRLSGPFDKVKKGRRSERGRCAISRFAVWAAAFAVGWTCLVWSASWAAESNGGAAHGSATSEGTHSRPNIVFVLADDLGWGDLGCYGNRHFRTPHLDRLAAQGTLFTQYYQAGSVCSPTRASLLTGRFPAELRIHGHLASPEQNAKRDMPNQLDPAVPTLPRLLRTAGYTTIHVGKWHLGRSDKGVEGLEEYGFDCAEWIDCRLGERNLWSVAERAKATGELIDSAISLIDRHREKPFYCQVWLHDPHAPLAPSAEQMKPFRRSEPEGFTSPAMVYAATVVEMDRQIGRLLTALSEMDLERNTLVIFSSDNGPEDIEIGNATWSAYGSAGPLRGRKRSLYEGGVRVPFIVRWPGKVPGGRVDRNSVIASVDLLPTLCAVAGATVPAEVAEQVRGENVAAALQGQADWSRHTPLYWQWRFRVSNHPWNRSPQLAVREGRWKLLLNPDRSRIELYDITADPGEQNNVAGQQPEVVEALAQKVLAWEKTLPPGVIEPAAGRADYPWPGEK